MAFDLIIWKWAEDAKTTDLEEIVAAISEDNPHVALARFNMVALETSLRERFGSVNDDLDSPFSYEVFDFKGVPANWITISIPWSKVNTVYSQILEIAHAQQLAVFDPQSGQVSCPHPLVKNGKWIV